MERLIVWAIDRFVGGPGRSWLFTGIGLGAYRLVRSVTGRQERVETIKLGKGKGYTVDHVTTTHARQLKAERRTKRADRRVRRRSRLATLLAVARWIRARLGTGRRDAD